MTYLFNDNKTIRVERERDSSINSFEITNIPNSLTDNIQPIALPYGNKLIEIATPIITTYIYIVKKNRPKDITQFRNSILKKINEFIHYGKTSRYHDSIIEKAAFIFCASFDELILNTAWGQDSGWENSSLLSLVFNSREGGEYFFDFLDSAYRKPDLLTDFLELQYYILSLGFKGKYLHDNNRLANIYHSVYLKLNMSVVVKIKKTSRKITLTRNKLYPRNIFNYKLITTFLILLFFIMIGISEYGYYCLSQDVISLINNDIN